MVNLIYFMIKNNSKIAKNAEFNVNIIYLSLSDFKYAPVAEQTVVYIIFKYFFCVSF